MHSKITINWNKYLPKTKNQAQNRYLDYLIDSRFQGVNRLFVLSFKDDDDRESHKQYYIPTVEIRRNFLDQPIKSELKAYDNIAIFLHCFG